MSAEFFTSLLADGLFAAIAATGFVVISNPPWKAVPVAAGLAAIGHGLRFALLETTSIDIVLATGIASLIIGLLSIFFAKKIHCPAEVFSFPSVIPMLPGMFAYKTILNIMGFLESRDEADMQEYITQIFENGLKAFFILLAIVVGISFSMYKEKTLAVTRKTKKA